MTTVVQISDYRHRPATRAANDRAAFCFDRHELDLILSVYSDRVIKGEWKDYAIHHDASLAAFHIYNNASRQPLLTVAKHRLAGNRAEFAVYDRLGKQMKTGTTLRDTLAVLKRGLRLVGH